MYFFACTLPAFAIMSRSCSMLRSLSRSYNSAGGNAAVAENSASTARQCRRAVITRCRTRGHRKGAPGPPR